MTQALSASELKRLTALPLGHIKSLQLAASRAAQTKAEEARRASAAAAAEAEAEAKAAAGQLRAELLEALQDVELVALLESHRLLLEAGPVLVRPTIADPLPPSLGLLHPSHAAARQLGKRSSSRGVLSLSGVGPLVGLLAAGKRGAHVHGGAARVRRGRATVGRSVDFGRRRPLRQELLATRRSGQHGSGQRGGGFSRRTGRRTAMTPHASEHCVIDKLCERPRQGHDGHLGSLPPSAENLTS
jgi:hypothetical protein